MLKIYQNSLKWLKNFWENLGIKFASCLKPPRCQKNHAATRYKKLSVSGQNEFEFLILVKYPKNRSITQTLSRVKRKIDYFPNYGLYSLEVVRGLYNTICITYIPRRDAEKCARH